MPNVLGPSRAGAPVAWDRLRSGAPSAWSGKCANTGATTSKPSGQTINLCQCGCRRGGSEAWGPNRPGGAIAPGAFPHEATYSERRLRARPTTGLEILGWPNISARGSACVYAIGTENFCGTAATSLREPSRKKSRADRWADSGRVRPGLTALGHSRCLWQNWRSATGASLACTCDPGPALPPPHPPHHLPLPAQPRKRLRIFL